MLQNFNYVIRSSTQKYFFIPKFTYKRTEKILINANPQNYRTILNKYYKLIYYSKPR